MSKRVDWMKGIADELIEKSQADDTPEGERTTSVLMAHILAVGALIVEAIEELGERGDG